MSAPVREAGPGFNSMDAGNGPHGARGLGDILSGLLGRKGALRRPVALEDARRAWIEAAGSELAGHTRVTSLRNGLLTVEVDSPPLCHRLAAFQKEDLLHRVQERLKRAQVTGIRFRLGAFAEE